MKAYHDKGRVSPILDDVPLFAVMVEDLGVRGAHKNAEIVRFSSTNQDPKFVLKWRFSFNAVLTFFLFYIRSGCRWQEYEKFESRKIAILNRAAGTPGATGTNMIARKSSDPIEERLRKMEADASTARKLSQISVALAACVAGGMALSKSK